MSLTLSSLFCCATARKPARNQTQPPEYSPSETDSLLDRGTDRENANVQPNHGAGESAFQKWEAMEYKQWKKSKSTLDFDSWLADRHRPELDQDTWEAHQSSAQSQRLREAYYTNRPRPGRRVNRLG